MKSRKMIEKVFAASLHSVNPEVLIKGYAEKILSYYSMKNFRKLLVVGFGKASYQMATALEEAVDTELITGGIVVTKYGHSKKKRPDELMKIKVYEAAHPIPDENGIKAAEEIIKLLKNADKRTLVICLISGGGSALFVSPYEGITLQEKQSITDLLLKAGADISELNSVRKHLSKVKGGRLAEIAYPAEMISLMISDVIGDRLDVIASGPTAPDSSTYRDALDVLNKYGLADKAPSSVIGLFKRGVDGDIPDTPKKSAPIFKKVQNIIIGSNMIAIEAARKKADSLGFETEILSTEVEGDVADIGKWLAVKAHNALRVMRERKKTCLISGGEPTVVVKGAGKGGRNTELALRFAMEIEGIEGVTMLSAGTDGTDGPTDAAGAVVDGRTIAKAKSLGLNPQEYLDNNDSYNFFNKLDSLVITGPTGTNVMDLHLVLIESVRGK